MNILKNILYIAVLAAVTAAVIYTVYHLVIRREEHVGNPGAVRRVKVRVSSKRTGHEAPVDEGNHGDFTTLTLPIVPTAYYVTFETLTGHKKKEFRVSGKVYGFITEQETGTLIYQEDEFIDFLH